MLAFEEPLPIGVQENLLHAVTAFGKEILPILHRRLQESDYSGMAGFVIYALGDIADPSSTPYLIECHKHGTFMTSAAALASLRKLRTPDGYEYMGKLLIEWAQGNKRVFNSGLEMVIACKALGEWGDSRAITPLMQATHISHADGMPRVAIEELAKFAQAHQFLRELGDREPSLREIINNALRKI